MDRRICLSIGVSTVHRLPGDQAGFAVLDGAVLAANCIGSWAVAAGFGDDNVSVVTDDRAAGAVTVDRIRKAVAALFPDDAPPVAHMVVSFCGHGMTSAEVGSIFWLFSDSLGEQYRVNVDAFVAELLKYGAARITLISDACRDGPADLDLQRLDARRVVIGPDRATKTPQFDRLAACQDGETAFMVWEQGSALPGKCVFSGVIADVLWRREESAITNGAVTTFKLGEVARARTIERARDYALELYPQCLVDPQVMTLVAAAPALPPEDDPQPWPPVAAATLMGQVDLDVANGTTGQDPAQALDRIALDDTFRSAMLGADFGKGIEDLDFTGTFPGFSNLAAGPIADLIKLRAVRIADDMPAADRWIAGRRTDDAIRRLEGMAATHARKTVAVALRQMGKRPAAGRRAPDANMILIGVGVGVGVRAIWGAEDASVERGSGLGDGASSWHVATGKRSNSVVIETDDAVFTPVTLYDDMQVTVSPDPRGGYVLAYGDGGDDDGVESGFAAVGDLAAGTLSPADIDRLVARLRGAKHVDPVLGVIAAYLYRAIADLDSIRRMAYFYAQHRQPVPFDIVLLGEMAVTRSPAGPLLVHVPHVARRAGPSKDLPHYVTQATPAVSVSIGGSVPWLSIGWDYATDPDPRWAALVEGLAVFAPFVKRSGFTNLPSEAGNKLVAMLNFKSVAIPQSLPG